MAFGKILGEDRKPFKTREGSVPNLSSVLDEAVQRAKSVVDDKSTGLTEDDKEDVAEKIDQLGPLVEDLLAKGIAEISDDAVCIFSNKELDRKDDPLLVSRDGEWVPVPCMIRKNDGGYN